MSKKSVSMTGVWHGLYSYPAYMEPVFFKATLISHGIGFSGMTHEAVVGFRDTPFTVTANLEGSVQGLSVDFKKAYDGSGGWTHFVMYAGFLSDDHNELEGTWTLPGDLSGRFMMMRGLRVTESLMRDVYEKVD
jgi:hypothetical protein